MGWDRFQNDYSIVFQTFQSTHPVWDGTTRLVYLSYNLEISIHPSRVGWDRAIGIGGYTMDNFNPPIPCGMGQKEMKRNKKK